MRIEINILDPASIDKAIQQVEEYQAKLERDLKYIVREAAARGVDIVRAEYLEAPYPGTKDFRVTYHLSNDGYTATIEASGQSVLFLEFGAGLFKASAPMAVLDLESGAPLPHGTYGKGKGKNPKGWAYVGDIGSNPPSDTYTVKDGKVVRTMGNDAVPAVWHAKKAMKAILNQLINEVNGRP